MSKPRVFFIDDERTNLINFEQAFHKEYKIFTAGSGEEALALLAREKREMAVVITDQRMPGMSGIDVLAKIRNLYPDSVRMVITAYTEVGELLDSINRGNIYKYIVKPWDENSLRVTLKNAVELYKLTKENGKLLDELSQANAELEERISKRTSELDEANNALKRINNQLVKAQFKMQAQANELESVNQTLNEKVVELEAALAKVKVLHGLLPICSYCKKIRDDSNYWQELECYMKEHADIAFTHSVCPECYDHFVRADLEAFRKKANDQKGLSDKSHDDDL